jgi:4-amino-4-deoxy-L-arabinose transferase-like glycosyltransferase
MAFQTLAKEKAIDSNSVLPSQSNWSLTKENWQFLAVFGFVFLCASFLIFYNLGNFPLFNPDEALYAEPAREMLETGQYVTTLLNYAVRFTKPPLVIWAMAANYQLFGVNEFAARYFGAACGAILVAATYLFTRAQINKRAALIAAFALMTAPLFFGTAREAITDMPLSLFLTGGLMCFYQAYSTRLKSIRLNDGSGLNGSDVDSTASNSIGLNPNGSDSTGLKLKRLNSNNTGLLVLAYACLGLAVMTKGPVGIILPIAILGIYHLLRWDVKSALLFYKPWFGILLVALIAVPWFALEISLTKGAYYKEFILRENFQRFTGVVDHKAAWWYHIAAMFGGFFPWSIFLPGALLGVVIPKLGGSKNPLTYFQNLTRRQSVMLFATCASVIILGFFSAGVSKLIPYTLPAFPMLALLVGGYVDELFIKNAWKPLTSIFAILAVVYGGAMAAIPILGAKLHDCPSALLSAISALLVVHAVAAFAAAVLSFKKKYPAALITFTTASFLAVLFIGDRGLEAVSNQWETPIQSFSEFAGASKDTIIVYQMRKPSVTFYAKRKFLLPKSPKELSYILSKTNGAYIISRSRSEKDLQAQPGTKHLCQIGQYVLTSYARDQGTSSTEKVSDAKSVSTTLDQKESNSDE